MQAHLGLVHEEHIRLTVLDEHREQDDEHLLLAARELVWHERLAHLRELYLVCRPHYLLPRIGEELVHDVLEFLLRLGQGLRLRRRIGSSALQGLDDTVAHVHLIVEILALQGIQLPVELRHEAQPHLAEQFLVHHGVVKRAYDVKPYPLRVFGHYAQSHALEHVAGEFAACRKSLHHLVDDGALAHSVHSAQDVHAPVEIPQHVFPAAP